MSITDADLAVDRELAEISGLLMFLRYTTPVNTAEEYQRFLTDGAEPVFEYLPLPDLTEVSARLTAIEPEQASDPMIGHIGMIKKNELELILQLLKVRGSDEFFLGAVELFGHVDTPLVETANQILDHPWPTTAPTATVGPFEFAAAAHVEVDHYRSTHPEMTARVYVSETTTGMRVENGDLYLGADLRVPETRVEPLLQHEVGVHVLTYANGAAQPLKLLAAGLPGYEENQEAMGVLAEYLSGGLAPSRLRVLALRVLAPHLRSNGAAFVETFNALRHTGAGSRIAFTTTMRSYRAGGMTRDASYLRGFLRLLDHLADGGKVDHLLVGKVRLEDEPLVDDLLERKVLGKPPLTPRFMESSRGQERLTGLRNGIDILEIGQT